jgi:hypothetical protein
MIRRCYCEYRYPALLGAVILGALWQAADSGSPARALATLLILGAALTLSIAHLQKLPPEDAGRLKGGDQVEVASRIGRLDDVVSGRDRLECGGMGRHRIAPGGGR